VSSSVSRRRSLGPAAWLVAVATLATLDTAQAADSPTTHGRRTASPEGAIATESSQVLPKWTPAASISLAHEVGIDRPSTRADLRARTGADLALAFGMFDWIELSAQLPIALRQRVATPDGQITASGLGDVRAGLKGTLLRLPRRGFGLGVMFDVTAPTGSGSRMLGIGTPTYAPQLLLEARGARAIRVAIALGYVVRNDHSTFGHTVGDEVTMRGAVRVPLSPTRQIAAVAEVDSRVGLVRGAQHGVGGRLGLRGQTRAGIVIGAYATAMAPLAFGTGEVGGLFAIGWAPPGRAGTERAFDGSERPRATALALRHDAIAKRAEPEPTKSDPRDPDADGVFASSDQCPSAAEDRDGFADGDGCPELDDDRDAIADAFDLCPRAPEIVNGMLDVDGCPDRDDGEGNVVTMAQVDWSALTPKLAFADGTDALTAESLAALDRWIELARLNPWITRLEVAVYVHPSKDPTADRARAQSRADAIVARVRTAGIDPWRVEVRELGAVPADVAERTRVAVVGGANEHTALAPEPSAMKRWVASETRMAAPAVEFAAQGPEKITP
jgi:hypothetical protein